VRQLIESHSVAPVVLTAPCRLEVIAAQVAASPHIEFHLRWATEILQNHAAWLQVRLSGDDDRPSPLAYSCTHEVQQDPSGRQACSGSLRSVQKSLFDSMADLSRLSDSNLHALRYMVCFIRPCIRFALQLTWSVLGHMRQHQRRFT
jgi:hypothetical protein